ncbi:unnamed protein product, partial [Mesorhabditis spiculigera]
MVDARVQHHVPEAEDARHSEAHRQGQAAVEAPDDAAKCRGAVLAFFGRIAPGRDRPPTGGNLTKIGMLTNLRVLQLAGCIVDTIGALLAVNFEKLTPLTELSSSSSRSSQSIARHQEDRAAAVHTELASLQTLELHCEITDNGFFKRCIEAFFPKNPVLLRLNGFTCRLPDPKKLDVAYKSQISAGTKYNRNTILYLLRDSTTANGPAPATPSKLPATMSNIAGAHISLRTMAPPPPPHNKRIAGVASRTPPKETTPNAPPHHLITQFPVRTPTRETAGGIIHAHNTPHNSPRWDQKHHQDAANDNQHHQRAIDHRHPPTMTHSTHGSRTRAEERLEQDQMSRPLSLEGCAHPLLLNPTPGRVLRSINRQPSAPQITTSNVILHSPTRHLGPAHPPMPLPISQHQSTPPQHNIINNNPTSSPSRRLQDSQFIQTPRISLDSFVRLRHSQQEPRTAGSPISNNPQQRLSLRAKKRQQRRAVQSEYVDAPLNAFPPTWRPIPIHREAPPPPSAATAQRNPSYLSATLLHKDTLRTSPRVSSRL